MFSGALLSTRALAGALACTLAPPPASAPGSEPAPAKEADPPPTSPAEGPEEGPADGASSKEPQTPGATSQTTPAPAAPAGEATAPVTPSEGAPAGEGDTGAQPAAPEDTNPNLPSGYGGGVGGSVVAADDPKANEATAQLEGEGLTLGEDEVPEKMHPLVAGAWWTLFGSVTLATTGGVFAGLAQSRQRELEGLAYGVDPETGSRFVFADVSDEYQELEREGEAFAKTAQGLLISGGIALVGSIILFAVSTRHHGKGTRAKEKTARVRPLRNGLQLRF